MCGDISELTLLNFLQNIGQPLRQPPSKNDLTPNNNCAKLRTVIESHSIKERAYIFHIIDNKEIVREEREKHEESEEGKSG